MGVRTVTALAAVGVIHVVGCTDRPGDKDIWRASIDTVGSFTTVRTLSGSVWQDTASLLEEASIGALEGTEAYLLGNVVGVAAQGDRIGLGERPSNRRTWTGVGACMASSLSAQERSLIAGHVLPNALNAPRS